MKRLLVVILIFSVAAGVFAQRANEVGATNVDSVGIDTAQQYLKEVSVDKFEKDGYWVSRMSPDDGFTSSRLFYGSPAGKEAIPDEEGRGISDKYVLGTRVDFIHRGHSHFLVSPIRPIPIEGITKLVSVWVAGRNFNHELKLIVEDFFGREFELYVGKLNFQGWKKMTVPIPPQAEDGRNGIVQRNYHYNNNLGLKIRGFRIDVDPMQAYGSYYIYFDDLRAITDLFAEENRDPDDMPDGW